MMFDTLSALLAAAPVWMAVGALAWGVASIWLSPCHLAGIPLLVAYFSGEGASGRRVLVATTFALGILASLVPVGGIAIALGRLAGDLGVFNGIGATVVALVFVAAGLYLLGALPLNWTRGLPTPKSRGLPAVFGLGFVFGFAVGPCAFAYLAPVLGAAWLTAAAKPLLAVALVGLFALGHCLGVIIAALFLDRVRRAFDALGKTRGLVGAGKTASGMLLLLAAGYLLAGVSG
jgi:cytochrome c-type biogenesis protein